MNNFSEKFELGGSYWQVLLAGLVAMASLVSSHNPNRPSTAVYVSHTSVTSLGATASQLSQGLK